MWPPLGATLRATAAQRAAVHPAMPRAPHPWPQGCNVLQPQLFTVATNCLHPATQCVAAWSRPSYSRRVRAMEPLQNAQTPVRVRYAIPPQALLLSAFLCKARSISVRTRSGS